MANSKIKTLEIARVSLERFFLRNVATGVWFWTFSEPGRKLGEPLWTKDEAEQHFKPFEDLCRRKGVELLVVWQLQARGSWHPHCLINRYMDVVKLRAWMMDRGWGPQMKAVKATVNEMWVPGRHGDAWVHDASSYKPLCEYLVRYLTRSLAGVATAKRKKCFGGSHSMKAGTVMFKWMPEIRAGSYLWNSGRSLFVELFGKAPGFRDMALVIRLGVEETGWANVDFLWQFGFPDG